MPVTAPSTCPWLDRPVSGLLLPTKRPIKTRFPYGSPKRLTLPVKVTRCPIIQKVRSHTRRIERSHCLYAFGFRFYFTPLTRVLFAFPSRYWFTIGQLRVFSLGGWSPHIQTRFHVPRPTRFHFLIAFVYGAITLYRATFQKLPLTIKKLKGFSPFARRYSGNLG